MLLTIEAVIMSGLHGSTAKGNEHGLNVWALCVQYASWSSTCEMLAYFTFFLLVPGLLLGSCMSGAMPNLRTVYGTNRLKLSVIAA